MASARRARRAVLEREDFLGLDLVMREEEDIKGYNKKAEEARLYLSNR